MGGGFQTRGGGVSDGGGGVSDEGGGVYLTVEKDPRDGADKQVFTRMEPKRHARSSEEGV